MVIPMVRFSANLVCALLLQTFFKGNIFFIVLLLVWLQEFFLLIVVFPLVFGWFGMSTWACDLHCNLLDNRSSFCTLLCFLLCWCWVTWPCSLCNVWGFFWCRRAHNSFPALPLHTGGKRLSCSFFSFLFFFKKIILEVIMVAEWVLLIKLVF